MSPCTCAERSPLPMCWTDAPPDARTPSMAWPMLPFPKMVTLLMTFLPKLVLNPSIEVTTNLAEIGCRYKYRVLSRHDADLADAAGADRLDPSGGGARTAARGSGHPACPRR